LKDVRPFTESDDTGCCNNTICPPEDEHSTSRNMSRIIMYHIQDDSGGICNTLGNDTMCDSKQKKVYINMGPILDGYGVMTAWNLE